MIAADEFVIVHAAIRKPYGAKSLNHYPRAST
jgi:hypothetical protein